jgi:hypothetical protein
MQVLSIPRLALANYPSDCTMSDRPMNPSEPLSKWVHLFTWGSLLAVMLALIGVGERLREKNVWQHWIASQDFLKPSYTEAIHAADLFRTQANTWSNLAYVLVGLYCIAL